MADKKKNHGEQQGQEERLCVVALLRCVVIDDLFMAKSPFYEWDTLICILPTNFNNDSLIRF